MGFWKEVGDTISNAGKDVVESSKEAMDNAKIKGQINDLEKENEKLQKDIGAKYVASDNNKINDSDVEPLTKQISENKQKIEALKQQMQDNKEDSHERKEDIKDQAHDTKEQGKQSASSMHDNMNDKMDRNNDNQSDTEFHPYNTNSAVGDQKVEKQTQIKDNGNVQKSKEVYKDDQGNKAVHYEKDKIK